MTKDMRNNKKGFTLVEIVIALMLSVILMAAIAPVVMTGFRMLKARQQKLEAGLLGDSIFQCAARELQNMEFNNDDTDDIVAWLTGEYDLQKYGFEAEIRTEPSEHGWICLQVKLLAEGSVTYEREEMIFLPNQELSKEHER